MKLLIKRLLLPLVILGFTSCEEEGGSNSCEKDRVIFVQGTQLPYTILKKLSDNTEIRNGGFGSAACKHPTNKSMFYAMTDRGPNIKFTGAEGKGKKFPVPTYSPRIGLFQLRTDGTISLEKEILLKNPLGGAITGLPNPEGKGATGEVPYDMNGNLLTIGTNGNGTDDYGLDTEGLVAMKDGTFWVSDEYGPHIIHFDTSGTEIERISPKGINGTTGNKLPAVFAHRRPNRGMEGLTVTPDEKILVGIMQSTMYNPDKTTKNSNITRIVTYEIATGETKQYLYAQEKNQNANSEITALSATEFLVIERDTNYPGDTSSSQKYIYKINISNATDVGIQNHKNLFDDRNGYKIGEKTLEQCTIDEIKAAGIQFVSKELVADLVKLVNYPHDKLEGIWLMNDNKIGLLNDDDFAVATSNGQLVQKHLPPSNLNAPIDANALYIINF